MHQLREREPPVLFQQAYLQTGATRIREGKNRLDDD